VLPHNLLKLREALIGFRATVAVLLKLVTPALCDRSSHDVTSGRHRKKRSI
jgi:hypothetical protein